MAKDWNGDNNSIFKTLGASNHTANEREENDYYATDPTAIDKLLAAEKPHRFIWECACGQGHLSERLKQKGFIVFSSDLINRGYPGAQVKDFLTAVPPPVLATFLRTRRINTQRNLCYAR